MSVNKEKDVRYNTGYRSQFDLSKVYKAKRAHSTGQANKRNLAADHEIFVAGSMRQRMGIGAVLTVDESSKIL